MASLFKRKDSCYWWVKYRHHRTGERRAESTGLRHGVARDTRRAKELVAELTLKERRTHGVVARERWGMWVVKFLDSTYQDRPNTLHSYMTAWKSLALFFDEKELLAPRFISRHTCFEYVEWRKQPDKSKGRYRAQQNTAIHDLRVLAIIMKEAVGLGFASHNPCRELGLRKTSVRLKPVFDEADIALVRERVELEPEPNRTFLRHSFEIARYQGCRLSETHINPQTDLTIENGRGRIQFKAKGGRVHVAPIHPALLPLLAKLKESGATESYQRPRYPGAIWYDFLKRIGLKAKKPGICFHALRVTVATELARANVHESKAMKYLGHASTTVHRTYQRLRPDDLDDALNAIGECEQPRPTGKTS